MTTPTIIIPAFQPTDALVDLIDNLQKQNPQQDIIVVNDGSDAKCQRVFDALSDANVTVLAHAKNMGKGAALKTAFKFWCNSEKNSKEAGVVTADADGQHAVLDISHVSAAFSKNPINLYIGAREFSQKIPLRSKFGNLLTRFVFKNMSHVELDDTQSGLRAIPRVVVQEMLQSQNDGYDFELEMLLKAAEMNIAIKQIPIKTIYIDNNKSSHFNPITDSVRIYFVFIRYASISLVSSLLDYLIFFGVFVFSKGIFVSTASGRVLSGVLNFNLNRRYAFRDNSSHFTVTGIKYFALAIVLTGFLYFLIRTLHVSGINIFYSKVIAEVVVYAFNFTIQRYFIFKTAPVSKGIEQV